MFVILTPENCPGGGTIMLDKPDTPVYAVSAKRWCDWAWGPADARLSAALDPRMTFINGCNSLTGKSKETGIVFPGIIYKIKGVGVMTGGIFAVLDDIAVLLDDVAVMSKVAAKKTAGILGDDLAVNAEKATGFQASRELPVLWAITKGSFVNKLIILPLAFLLSAYAPWLVVPILLLGGAYLSYEGVEKIYHVASHKSHGKPAAKKVHSQAELLKIEATKIKSAIRTDFILSIEIVMIALGTVMTQKFMVQVVVVSFIAILATIGVYGVVALLVRMDDMGLYMTRRASQGLGVWAKMLDGGGATADCITSLGYSYLGCHRYHCHADGWRRHVYP